MFFVLLNFLKRGLSFLINFLLRSLASRDQTRDLNFFVGNVFVS